MINNWEIYICFDKNQLALFAFLGTPDISLVFRFFPVSEADVHLAGPSQLPTHGLHLASDLFLLLCLNLFLAIFHALQVIYFRKF